MSSKVVSCVYDLLDMGTTGQWKDDGTIILNRPPASTKLDKIKFRSFSANIKSTIQNTLTPTLNCSLCANVEILNSTPTAPNNIKADELSAKPKLLTDGNITNNYSLNILNQTGLKSYNNLYGTNTIKISDFTVPLNNSIRSSIQTGITQAKTELLKTLGLSPAETADQSNFDFMSFQYGDYRYKLNEFPTNLATLNPILTVHNKQDEHYNVQYVNIVPKECDRLTLLQYNPTNKTLNQLQQYNYNVYGIGCHVNPSTQDTVTNFWVLTDEEKLQQPNAFYQLPDKLVHFDIDTSELVVDVDLTTNAAYMRFVNSAPNGLVLSSTIGGGASGMDVGSQAIVCMASKDVVDHPSYMCASLQRMLYNTEEFKMYCISTQNGAILDLTTQLYSMLQMCQAAGCPTTAYFVKFDVRSSVNGGPLLNVIYFMDLGINNEKTFYVYVFNGTHQFNGTSIFTDPMLKYKDSRTFVESTNVFVSNYKEWSNIIDTYYGSQGGLAFNIGSLQALYALGEASAYWVPFDSYVGSAKGVTTCSSIFCDNRSVITTITRVIQNPSTNNTIVGRWCFDQTIIYKTSSWKTIDGNALADLLSEFQQTASNPLVTAKHLALVFYVGVTDKSSIYVSFESSTSTAYWYPSSVAQPSSGIRYTLANSMLSVDSWNGTLTPYLPTINEFGSGTDYNWINSTHIEPEAATGYQYVYYNCNNDKASDYNEFINSIFKWDQDNNSISFPVIPLYRTTEGSQTLYANLVFYMTFTTTPNVLSFDPNIKQGLRTSCDTYYSTYKQVLNKQPSLYIQSYSFDNYFIILDQSYYETLDIFLALRNSDQTLKLICNDFPTLNNIVFYLNETAMIDFKEAACSHNEAVIEARIVDYNGNILLPTDAPLIYSNIVIAIDWQFY